MARHPAVVESNGRRFHSGRVAPSCAVGVGMTQVFTTACVFIESILYVPP